MIVAGGGGFITSPEYIKCTLNALENNVERGNILQNTLSTKRKLTLCHGIGFC